MHNIHFTHELIKGKIAEIIFEQMIHNTRGYTILEFGYEKVVRQLAKQSKSDDAKDMIEIIRRAPDFAVINENTHDISLIEVKFMSELKKHRVLKAANNIKKSWKRASLFIANPDGFYFDQVDTIIKNKGLITSFSHKLITKRTQTEYLKLLNNFIQNR